MVLNYPLTWQMTNAEKIVLLKMMEDLRPEISIEIGTHKGGSLQVISEYSGKVYSLDINPEVKTELAEKFSNVEYLTGDSRSILPALLDKLFDEGKTPEFILIDGDHSTEGVMADINSILQAKFIKPVTVLMHDSFNPACREGMLKASYHLNKHIEYIELDFLHGIYSPIEELKSEMWCGFALFKINPGIINENVSIGRKFNFSFEQTYEVSKHRNTNKRDIKNSIRSFLFKW